MIIVDRNLKLSRFTPPATEIFQMSLTDVGQSIMTIPCLITLPDSFRKELEAVIGKNKTFEVELRSDDKFYLLQILPYYGKHDRVEGAIILFLDQSEIRIKEAELSKANEALSIELAERKRVEEEQQNTHIDLEMRVDKRTIELNETKKELQSTFELLERIFSAPAF